MNKVYGIKDRFHKYLYGDKTPIVRSDHPCFEGSMDEFYGWVKQHGADKSEVFEIDDTQEKLVKVPF